MPGAAVPPCETCQTLHLKCNGTKPFCWRNPERRHHTKKPTKTTKARQTYDRKCKWLGKIVVEALDSVDFGQPNWREQLVTVVTDQLYKPKDRTTKVYLEQAKAARSNAPVRVIELSYAPVNSSASSPELCTNSLVSTSSSTSSSSPFSNAGSAASSFSPDSFLPLTTDPNIVGQPDYPYSAGPANNGIMDFDMEHHLSPLQVAPQPNLYFSDYSPVMPVDHSIGTGMDRYQGETTLPASLYDEPPFCSSLVTAEVASYTHQQMETTTPLCDQLYSKHTDVESHAEQMPASTSRNTPFPRDGSTTEANPCPNQLAVATTTPPRKKVHFHSSTKRTSTGITDKPGWLKEQLSQTQTQGMAGLVTLEAHLAVVKKLNCWR